jgi:Spy/CpxP family protein refolding chaperone
MRTHKLKLVLIAASILALGAGVFAGMAVSRLPASAPPVISSLPARSSIADQLKLTDAQRDQMRGIWEDVRKSVHQTMDQAQAVERERDSEILALLSDSQKARYAALTRQASERVALLVKQRDQTFQEGVDKTRKILDDTQRETYDRIIRDRVGSGSESTSSGSNIAPPATEPALR